jgi:hypothetical protein
VTAPVVSVIPYTWMNRHLNVFIAARSVSLVIGDAPYVIALIDE